MNPFLTAATETTDNRSMGMRRIVISGITMRDIQALCPKRRVEVIDEMLATHIPPFCRYCLSVNYPRRCKTFYMNFCDTKNGQTILKRLKHRGLMPDEKFDLELVVIL